MIPLFSNKQVRDADKYAVEKLKLPGIALMENASLSIFSYLKEYFPSAKNVGIVSGKGNNGGDGFATARHLLNNNYNVLIVFIGKESELKGDALINYRVLKNLIKNHTSSKLKIFSSQSDLRELKNCDVIIDALLGTGTKGEPKHPYDKIIEYINQINSPKISVDLPSGLNLDNSTGNTIVNADLTVTLADFKSGLFYGKGYKHAGKVVKGSIGIGSEYFNQQNVSEYLAEPEDAYKGLPIKERTLHKYSNGKVLVVAGSGNYPGAAALTTNSVLKAGSGAVFLAYPKTVRSLVVPKLDEAILYPYDDKGSEIFQSLNVEELKNKIEWTDLIAIGPGLGRDPETIKAVELLLKHSSKRRLVIDADAIYAIGKIGLSKINLKNSVLTPHHSEFAGLIGISVDELQNDIIKYGKSFVRKYNCSLVLKGAPTLIFSTSGDVLINSSGNVGMAKFGTGDVLTGVIAGMSSKAVNFEEAIIASVYLHGLSADLLLEKYTEYGITPTLIMENLHNAISFLRNSFI
ncbi:MAG: NAD(P)H-hydrate dehydratase [Bacteroidota bacterium]